MDEAALARISGKKPVKVIRSDALGSVIFRVSCALLGNARMDAVVSPGRVSNHVHAFFGPESTSDTINPVADFAPSVRTTCNQKQDLSMYWCAASSGIDTVKQGCMLVVDVFARCSWRRDTLRRPAAFQTQTRERQLRAPLATACLCTDTVALVAQSEPAVDRRLRLFPGDCARILLALFTS